MGLNSEVTQAPPRRIATGEAAHVWEDRKGALGQTPLQSTALAGEVVQRFQRNGPTIGAEPARPATAIDHHGQPEGETTKGIFVCSATYPATQLVFAPVGEKTVTKRTRL